MSTESHDYLYATYIWILDVGDGIPKVGDT